MGRFAQLVIGPAGSGKSTYCTTMQRHFQTVKRPALMINLDPAAEKFHYTPDIDIRQLITLEDVMEELDLGPNGGLVFCMEYLLDNIDWLEEEIGTEWEEEYVIIDCPGQIELFTHSDIMKNLITNLQQRLHFSVCAVYLLESQFIIDTPKFLSGVLTAVSAMVQLEVPHVNVLSKLDLIEGRPGELAQLQKKKLAMANGEKAGGRDAITLNAADPDDPQVGYVNTWSEEEEVERQKRHEAVELEQYLDPSPDMLLHKISNVRDKYRGLTEAIVQLIDEFDMVSFLPLNIHDEESIETLLYSIDHATQFAEDQEPKDPSKGRDDDDSDIEDIVEQTWKSVLE